VWLDLQNAIVYETQINRDSGYLIYAT